MITKIEQMDKQLEAHWGEITSSEICRIVRSIFGFDLDQVPVLTPATTADQTSNKSLAPVFIDSYVNLHSREISGPEIRRFINQIFGINLEALSSLEGGKVSIFSKGQWMQQNEGDLFVVVTGHGDVEVRIFPTDYFFEQTGLIGMPEELRAALVAIGFHYDEKTESCHFVSSSGEAVPDSFKGQTIGAILEFIRGMNSGI